MRDTIINYIESQSEQTQSVMILKDVKALTFPEIDMLLNLKPGRAEWIYKNVKKQVEKRAEKIKPPEPDPYTDFTDKQLRVSMAVKGSYVKMVTQDALTEFKDDILKYKVMRHLIKPQEGAE